MTDREKLELLGVLTDRQADIDIAVLHKDVQRLPGCIRRFQAALTAVAEAMVGRPITQGEKHLIAAAAYRAGGMDYSAVQDADPPPFD